MGLLIIQFKEGLLNEATGVSVQSATMERHKPLEDNTPFVSIPRVSILEGTKVSFYLKDTRGVVFGVLK